MSEVDQARRDALREEMWTRYGRPTLGPAEEGFLVVCHGSKESADAFWAQEEAHPGDHPVPHWVEERDGSWVHIYDIRAEMARLHASLTGADVV